MDRKPQVKVFRPTMDEFKDFPRFVEYMESAGAHKVGLAKVLLRKCCCSDLMLIYFTAYSCSVLTCYGYRLFIISVSQFQLIF